MPKESIIKKILALMAKTTENGCTEQEAMLAAKKVQQMLHDYQLSLSDLEIRESKCEQVDYDTMEKDPFASLIATGIAIFTDTRCWRETRNGYTHIMFFGLEHDVIVAEYILKICDWALVNGWEDSKDEYPKQGRPKFKKSYMHGMASRLRERIVAMKNEQKQADIESSGRDLVVIKGQVVTEEFAKLGLNLTRGKRSSFSVDPGAYSQGSIDADKVGLNPGVGTHSNTQIS
jgi:hypothetical protein